MMDENKDELKLKLKYKRAVELLNSNKTENIEEALLIFNKLDGFRDSSEKVKVCKDRLSEEKNNIKKSRYVKYGVSFAVFCLVLGICLYHGGYFGERTDTDYNYDEDYELDTDDLDTDDFDTDDYDDEGYLSKQKKLRIMGYINGIMDPLNEDTSLSDEYLEKKANEVWRDAAEIYDVDIDDIMDIMSDYELIKEYYGADN